MELSEQEIGRRQSLDALRQMGIDPYPAAAYPTDAFSTDIKNSFDDAAPAKSVCIAGRIMSRRIMGKASFIELARHCYSPAYRDLTKNFYLKF